MRSPATIFPSFGWTYLSRKALRDAEAQLQGTEEGIRDEIGFMRIHRIFADRFFPGTSVLHTRLRYVLFVPWMYGALKERRAELRGRGAAEFETRLAARLRNWARSNNQTGVIGDRNTRRILATRPSAIYWNAMCTWGILKPGERGRIAWERALERPVRKVDTELEERDKWFGLVDPELPAAPDEFLDEERDLGFELGIKEKKYLRGILRGIKSADGSTPLLAKLIDRDSVLLQKDDCFDPAIVNIADDDSRWLRYAAGASALCGIGRGVYAALVEQLREQDKTPDQTPSHIYRDELAAARPSPDLRALKMDIDAMESDLKLGLGTNLRRVLTETQTWLGDHKKEFTELIDAYRIAEWDRKKRKSCLQLTNEGRTRRAEWRLDPALGSSTAVVPLHYRWGTVQRLLRDLIG